jgi:hypothetical protein
MLDRMSRATGRFFSRLYQIDRLFDHRQQTTPRPQRRTRLELLKLEDRIVPTTQVGIQWIADASEANGTGTVRISRQADPTILSSQPLTVSLKLSGTATPGSDYTLSGASASSPALGQTFTVTLPAGASFANLNIQAIDDALGEGWESITAEVVEDSAYTIGTANSALVWLEDNDLWLEADAETIYRAQEVTFYLPYENVQGLTIAWDADYDGTSFEAMTGETDEWLTTQFTTVGERTIAARVTDASGIIQLVTLDVDVETPPPVVTPMDDFVTEEGETHTLSVDIQAEAPIESIEWWVSFSSREYEINQGWTTSSFSYTFEQSGIYDFWCVVTDELGNESEGWFRVYVNEALPDATISYANDQGVVGATIPEGSDVWFTISNLAEELDLSSTEGITIEADFYGTGDFDLLFQGDVDEYFWEMTPEESSIRFKNFYDDNNGTSAGYAAAFKIIDEWGHTAHRTITVNIANVAPAVTLKAGLHLANMAGANQEVWAVSPNQKVAIEVDDRSWADYEDLEVYWFVNDTQVENSLDLFAISLPSYNLGSMNNVEVFVMDPDGGRSTTYEFQTVVFAGLDALAIAVPVGSLEGGSEFWISPQLGANASVAGSGPHFGLIHPPTGGGGTGGTGGLGEPGGPAGPGGGGPSVGGSVSRGAVYGTLVREGDTAPAQYNRYAHLPVIHLNKHVDLPSAAHFQLDTASAALINSTGTNVKYKFTVEIYDVTQYSFLPQANVLLERHFVVQNTGTLNLQSLVQEWAVADRIAVVTGIAEIVDASNQVTHSSPPYQLIAFAPLTPTVVQQAFDFYDGIRTAAQQFGSRASELVSAIMSNPGRFLNIVGGAIQHAFNKFMGDLTANITQPFFKWLNKGINIPGTFDFSTLTGAGVTSYLLQYSGLTWDNIQNVIMQEIGTGNVAALSKVYSLLFEGVDYSNPNSLLDFLNKFTSSAGNSADLETLNFDQLKNDLVNKVVTEVAIAGAQMVPQLLAKFIPGAGNLLALVQGVYNGLTWLIDNRTSIQAMFDKLVAGIDYLIAPPANAAALLGDLLFQGMTQDAAPALLDLAASQLGLGKLKTQVQRALNYVPDQINKVLRASVGKIVKRVNVAVNPVYFGAIQQVDKDPASYAGKSYHLFAIKDSKGKAQIKLVDASGLLHRDRSFLLTRADFPTEHQGVFDAYLAAAQALANGSKAAKGASPKKPTPNVPDNALTQHNALLKAADDARKVLRDTINAHGCKILLAGCFAAGTKLLTREGWRAVETLREGDEVATRAENDVYGTIAFRPIEEVFVRTGRVLHLHLSDGQTIRTTPEHPFWVEELGWTPADMLRAGMRLATLGGEWVSVEETYDTGEYETVYNCRVAEHHTYFVGDDTHVLAVWAHNAYKEYYIAQDSAPGFLGKYTLFNKADGQIVQGTGGVIVRKDTFKLAADFFIHDPNGQAQTQGFPDPKRIYRVQMGPSFGWDGTLEDFNGGMDILGTSRPAQDPTTLLSTFDMHVLNPAKYSTSLKIKAHAHHIVMENGRGPQARADVLAAKAVLRKHQIDPYFSEENLIWAPNFSHTKDYARAVKIRLEAADLTGTKTDVIDALKKIGEDFKKGQWHVI